MKRQKGKDLYAGALVYVGVVFGPVALIGCGFAGYFAFLALNAHAPEWDWPIGIACFLLPWVLILLVAVWLHWSRRRARISAQSHAGVAIPLFPRVVFIAVLFLSLVLSVVGSQTLLRFAFTRAFGADAWETLSTVPPLLFMTVVALNVIRWITVLRRAAQQAGHPNGSAGVEADHDATI